MKAHKKPESLPGVSCDVIDCVYNSADKLCHADHIQVANNQTNHCIDETDTCCGTFEAK